MFGYTLQNIDWKPRLGFSANDISGDNAKSGAIGAFNPMFPRLPYFAETPLLAPSNVRDVREVFSFTLVSRVNVVPGYEMLWRSSLTGGLYGSGLMEFANTNKAAGSRVGSEVSADMRWRLENHLQLGAILAEFYAGPALTEAGGKNMTYAVLFAKCRF